MVIFGESVALLDSKAITKIQSIILIGIIVVAAIGGGAAYILLSGEKQPSDTIKIGVLADLDTDGGEAVRKGLTLAAEEINAEGGILSREVELIYEDDDYVTTGDLTKVSSALTRLLTYHHVDFVIADSTDEAALVCQDIIAEHKKIFIDTIGTSDTLTQRVLDDYDKYKYFFKLFFNATSISQGMTDSLVHLREITGFNKVGYIGEDLGWTKGMMDGLDYVLPEIYDFEVVYKGRFPLGTFDFASYFAAAEEAGVEILVPMIGAEGVPFIKEYNDRQSPMVIYGGILADGNQPDSWEYTDGKCEYIAHASYPIVTGYPLTSKTIPAREAFIDRWGETPTGINGYDILRFILPDAIERAGTIETDAVIKALEQTNIETTAARNFVFTKSHDVMMGENPNEPDAEYTLVFVFQWQNGKQIPVYPKKIMEEAGTSYIFPDWPGPWD
jgi:branched-chain amino acid transport system substrate-binding protein